MIRRNRLVRGFFGRVSTSCAGPSSAMMPPLIEPLHDWIHPRAEGSVLEFVHTGYPGADFDEFVRAKFDGVRTIDADPMPLRSIFTALARQKRDQNETSGGTS